MLVHHIGKKDLCLAFQEPLQKRFKKLLEKNTKEQSLMIIYLWDFISEVKKEGLKLCSQLKLQYKNKKDLKASRKYLGSFCNQYGIEMLVPPSHKTKNNFYHQKRKSSFHQQYQKKNYKKFKNYNIYKNKMIKRKKLNVLNMGKYDT